MTMYNNMDITRLQGLITSTIDSLPEEEAQRLKAIQDSLAEKGEQAWMLELNKYVNELIISKKIESIELSQLKSALATIRPSRLNKRFFQIIIILLVLVFLAVKYA